MESTPMGNLRHKAPTPRAQPRPIAHPPQTPKNPKKPKKFILLHHNNMSCKRGWTSFRYLLLL